MPPPAERNLNSRISESDVVKAASRPIREWMEIYIELLEQALKRIEEQQPGDDTVFKKYQTETRPRLRRILRDFEAAGLNLMDEIEFEGCHIQPGQNPIWEDTGRRYIRFFWPDGQELMFADDTAISAVAFFIFWQAHQEPVLGAKADKEGESRIILPGEDDHNEYFRAKAEDQG